MDFYDRVKALVKIKNMTIKGLLDSLGINFETYNSQRRFGNLPRTDDSVKIAQSLGVTVEYLVTGREPDNIETVKNIKKQMDIIKDKLDEIQ